MKTSNDPLEREVKEEWFDQAEVLRQEVEKKYGPSVEGHTVPFAIGLIELKDKKYNGFPVNPIKADVNNIEVPKEFGGSRSPDDLHNMRKSLLGEHSVISEEASDLPTIEKIDVLFDNFSEFLKEKNRRYGDSAINPIKIFSKLDAGSQICNRLDDKLGRISNSRELKKNDVSDIFGYIALLLISNDWLDFGELLD